MYPLTVCIQLSTDNIHVSPDSTYDYPLAAYIYCLEATRSSLSCTIFAAPFHQRRHGSAKRIPEAGTSKIVRAFFPWSTPTLLLTSTVHTQSHSELRRRLAYVCAAVVQSCSSSGLKIFFSGLVVYEFVITLDQEIAAVWRRKFTATSMLLLSTRWLMLLYPILAILPIPMDQTAAWCESTVLLKN